MFFRALTFATIGLTSAFLITGCTKTPTEPQTTSPSIPSITFKGPNTNSTDPNAQTLKSTVTSMNSYALMFGALKSIQGTQSANNWTWTYPEGTLTVKLIATTEADGSSEWTMTLNGVDTSKGVTYSNWIAGQGTISAGGKSGDWKLYDTSATTLAAEFAWSTTNNVLTGTLTSYSSGVLGGQTVIINNPDNSGQMTQYAGSSLAFKAVWQPDGSGEWWTYDPSGNQTGTGRWT